MMQRPSETTMSITCHICNSPSVELIQSYALLRRITSDCKMSNKEGKIGFCRSCGCVQKLINTVWQSEVNEIYKSYQIYHQSNGMEQAVFNILGESQPRSASLIDKLFFHFDIPHVGRILDVGCGRGAFLKAFSERAIQWRLAGLDLDDKYKSIIERIDRIEKLYTGSSELVPDTFNIVTMIHTLEHIPMPRNFLMLLKNKLTKNSLLLIQIPNYIQNPFDLLITDHCTHFTKNTIKKLLISSGYEIKLITEDWVLRELTIIACISSKSENTFVNDFVVNETDGNYVVRCIDWLLEMKKMANTLSRNDHFGIFGTSIAGTWLFSELERTSVKFFIDEDLSRVGQNYYGCNVYHPSGVADSSTVFMPFTKCIAESIKNRMGEQGFKFKIHCLGNI